MRVTTGTTRGLAIAAIALVTITNATGAQETTSRSNCDRASRAVAEKALPAAGAADWSNFVTLSECGSRGATVVAGVVQSALVRTETDAARLDALSGVLDGWFAPSLVAAYENVAATPNATPALRLRAMWLLGGLLTPTTEVAGPLQGYATTGCGTYERVTALRDAPASLPQQAYDDAHLAYSRAASDGAAPDVVRNTARCWGDVVRSTALAGSQSGQGSMASGSMNADQQTPVQQANTSVIGEPPYGPPPEITVVEPIEVRYECDGRFVVWNTSPSLVSLRYEVVGGGWGGYVHIGGRHSHILVAARTGPLRFYLGTREVAYVAYERRSCRGWPSGYTTILASTVYFPFYPRPFYRASPVVVVDRRGPVVVEPRRGRDVVVVPRARPLPVEPRTAVPRGGASRNENFQPQFSPQPRAARPTTQVTTRAPMQNSMPRAESAPRQQAPRQAQPTPTQRGSGGDKGGDKGGDGKGRPGGRR